MHTLRRITTFAAVSLALSAALPAAAHARTTVDYVALGDSYSSGSGTGSYTDSACKRSDLAYPALLAERLGAELSFEACFGATTGDVLAEQAAALDEDTDLVTLTVGGNDIDWNEAVVACMIPAYDCTGDIERSERIAENELPGLLDAVYSDIAARSPHAEVYVLGYPRLFSATKACDAFGLIGEGEQRRMNQGADLLSEVIESAAVDHGFTYVDVRDEFEGHAVCDDDEWLHGLTYPVGDSYHPKRPGHAKGYLPAITAAL
ncbi:SGNH/GDSL hydrolase family protein [Glycomyces tenuis]|uniref:SGNH/GDSL hydrolase family protein n=1 Tax=Glycomyces tenuis TaxID=58116 RepID=UPI00040F3C3D|nr:SGNH/GDSL hydrolase family protein [Glycomyces tenuis]